MRVEDYSVKYVVADILTQVANNGKAEGWSTKDPELTVWNLVQKELTKYNVYYVDDIHGIWERSEHPVTSVLREKAGDSFLNVYKLTTEDWLKNPVYIGTNNKQILSIIQAICDYNQIDPDEIQIEKEDGDVIKAEAVVESEDELDEETGEPAIIDTLTFNKVCL